MKTILISLALLFASPSFAQELGEILEISKTEGIVFFRGNIDLVDGEELIAKGKGGGNHLVRVTGTQGDKATADYLGYQVMAGGMVRNLEKGDRVRVVLKKTDIMFFDFFFGSVQAPKDYGFPGNGGALGLDVGGYLAEEWSWHLRLQADSWGTEPSGVEIRRSSYLVGAGYNRGPFRAKALIGTIDSMTILKDLRNPGYVNPFDGKTYVEAKVHNNNQFGYMINLTYDYDFGNVDRNVRWNWYLQPQVTYSNTFSAREYPAHTSIALAIGFKNTMF